MRKVLKGHYRNVHWDKPTHKEGTHSMMMMMMMIFQPVHDIQVFDIPHEEIPQSSTEHLAALNTLS